MANPFDQFDSTESVDNPFNQFDTAKVATPQKPSVSQNMAQGAYGTLQNVGKVYPVAETAANLATSTYGLPLAGLAGLAALPFGLDKAKNVMESVQKALIYQPQTSAGHELLGATNYPAEVISKVGEAAGEPLLKSGHPYLGATAASLIKAGPLLYSLGKVGGRAVLKPKEGTITQGIEKSIRPAVGGRRTFGKIKQFGQRANRAVKTIIKNKDNLALTNEYGELTNNKLPTNLKQFSQAIDQTKRIIYKKYSDLATKAGEAKVTISLKSITKELEKIGKSKTAQDLNPNVTQYANILTKSLGDRKFYTIEEAQDAIAILNNKLESYYKNPTYENATKATVDALIANRLRKLLDKHIDTLTGEKYQPLKNDYGALKSIERDVARRAIVDARKNKKGFFDLSQIWSAGEVVRGITGGGPSAIAKGMTMDAMRRYIKFRNNPNRIVKKMFQKAEMIGKKTKPKIPLMGAYLSGREQNE